MSRMAPRVPASKALFALALAVVAALAVVRLARPTEPHEAMAVRQAFSDGHYGRASDLVTGWLEASPDAPEAHLLNGRLAVAKGQLAEAAESLKRAQALGAGHDELDLLRALIASKAGRHGEAIPALSRAFAAMRPPDRQVDEALAKAYLETYDLTRALEVLDRWTRDFPDDPKPYLWRAQCMVAPAPIRAQSRPITARPYAATRRSPPPG